MFLNEYFEVVVGEEGVGLDVFPAAIQDSMALFSYEYPSTREYRSKCTSLVREYYTNTQ